ncbi:DUF3558 family protein [Rhodococcus sp. UNC23MFCrub1.1]|uniref:DUF3558 family protein n=1 Tax=Rhodococcus sp. UNC23MFCrub1.1 TaxID=1449068 RepID=UPI0018CC6882|nr:DUF3558 family protein [Rhodococcus sp. UNC23MFCrub1.1]
MAALVFCGACSPGVSGEPVAELWDPCTIPSDAIAAAGVNPEYIDSGRFDQDNNEWRYCSFRQDWFVLTVFSTANPLQEISDAVQADNPVEASVNGREALRYTEFAGTLDESCFVSISTTWGSVEFEISEAGTEARTEPLCDVATRYAERLEANSPR